MRNNLHSVSALAKTQLYVLKNYVPEWNEPWCYHTQFSYHLRIKRLSVPLFTKAVLAVLNRHPVLKTVLLFDGDDIKQAVNPDLSVRIQFEDISKLSADAQASWMENYLLADRNNPIDSYDQTTHLFRPYIVKRGSESLQLILTFNHAIWDGWSLAVLLKEIFEHYQALKNTPTLKLEPARYDYKDFLDYELQVSNSPQAKEFWATYLKDHQPFTPPEIPNDSSYDSYRPVERMLSPELSAGIQKIQKKLRVTIKSIFIAQFMRMVEEETQQSYNTIGVVTNGRSLELTNPLATLGLLWNMAPLSVEKLSDEIQHVKNVNRSLSDVSAHGSYPLIDILEDQNAKELFHAAFNFINFEGANLLPTDSDIEFLEVGGLDKFHFPLHLLVGKNPFNKNISLVLNYDTRRYTRHDVETKLDSYVEGLMKLEDITIKQELNYK